MLKPSPCLELAYRGASRTEAPWNLLPGPAPPRCPQDGSSSEEPTQERLNGCDQGGSSSEEPTRKPLGSIPIGLLFGGTLEGATPESSLWSGSSEPLLEEPSSEQAYWHLLLGGHPRRRFLGTSPFSGLPSRVSLGGSSSEELTRDTLIGCLPRRPLLGEKTLGYSLGALQQASPRRSPLDSIPLKPSLLGSSEPLKGVTSLEPLPGDSLSKGNSSGGSSEPLFGQPFRSVRPDETSSEGPSRQAFHR